MADVSEINLRFPVSRRIYPSLIIIIIIIIIMTPERVEPKFIKWRKFRIDFIISDCSSYFYLNR